MSLNALHPSPDEFKELLKREGIKIPLFRRSRLIEFMEHLRAETFNGLSSVEKRGLLKNFLALRKQGEIEGIRILSDRILRQSEAVKNAGPGIPQAVLIGLARALRTERKEDIKAVILSVFLDEEARLKNWFSPEDLVFTLWSEDVLLRSNAIRGLFRHYAPKTIVSALIKEGARSGRRLPEKALRCLFRNAEWLASLEKKKELLPAIKHESLKRDEYIEQIWADYLNGLSRYELIRMDVMIKKEAHWIKELKQCASQLSFEFRKPTQASSYFDGFRSRVQAILDEMPAKRD